MEVSFVEVEGVEGRWQIQVIKNDFHCFDPTYSYCEMTRAKKRRLAQDQRLVHSSSLHFLRHEIKTLTRKRNLVQIISPLNIA